MENEAGSRAAERASLREELQAAQAQATATMSFFVQRGREVEPEKEKTRQAQDIMTSTRRAVHVLGCPACRPLAGAG